MQANTKSNVIQFPVIPKQPVAIAVRPTFGVNPWDGTWCSYWLREPLFYEDELDSILDSEFEDELFTQEELDRLDEKFFPET